MVFCAAPAFSDGDVIFNIHGYLGSVFSSNYDAFPVNIEYGGGAKLSYQTPLGLAFFAGVDYLVLPRETETDETLSAASVLRGTFGLGYYIPLGERFGLIPSVNAGVYKLTVSSDSKTSLSLGGGISFVYKINPRYSIEIPALAELNRGIFADIGTVPGISVNLSNLFRNETLISMQVKEVAPVFPVLYSWYEKNPFATVALKNEEDAGITNVKVSFLQSQYMTQAKECATFDRIESGEAVDVDLLAFFNERMLELIEKIDAQGSVIVEYTVLGQKKEKSFPVTLGIYGRNSMSWDDDRRAAVFVSSKDPAAMLFSRHVMSSVRSDLRSGVPLNIQYAMGIFEALDEFGINYVIDPNSAYADNVGSTSIDFLQFPYQTLMYRGGDCDDLSILTCSLFEAVGIKTAFITIPGHIFIAFDSGVQAKDAWRYFNSLDEYIVSDGEVWVPLEITLSDEGYTKAWRVGSREWNAAARTGDAMLYKMSDSWELYRPVSVAGAQVKFALPEKEAVVSRFAKSVDMWISREIAPQIKAFDERLAKGEDAGIRNDYGILFVRYGLFDQAESQFQIARNLHNESAVLNTASMYFAKEQYENAAYLYNQVLQNDPNNTLAHLGLARCAFEVGDYKTCDEHYAIVKERDAEIARQYVYLGSFETVQGRAFSLSERLDYTIWVGSNAFMNSPKITSAKEADYYLRNSDGLSSVFMPSMALAYTIPEREEKFTREQTLFDSETGSSVLFAAELPKPDEEKALPVSTRIQPRHDEAERVWQKVIVKIVSEEISEEAAEKLSEKFAQSSVPLASSAEKSGKAPKRAENAPSVWQKVIVKEVDVPYWQKVIVRPVRVKIPRNPAPVPERPLVSETISAVPKNPATREMHSAVPEWGQEKGIPVLSEKDLRRDFFYIQVASFSEISAAETLCRSYPKYPLQIVQAGGTYRVLAGALTVDEYGALLEKFRSYGFADAFVRKIK